jgi:hypothetical protein
MAFAFCPYRLARLAGHYDLLGTEWIPLYVLALFKLAETERVSIPRVLAAGALAAACGYTASTYLVFLALLTVLFLAVRPRIAARAGAVAAVAAVLLLPMLEQAYADRTSWTYAPYPGVERYVADLASYFAVLGESSRTDRGGARPEPHRDQASRATSSRQVSPGRARRRIPGVSFWLASRRCSSC